MAKQDLARLGRALYEVVAKELGEERLARLALPRTVSGDLWEAYERVARRVYSLGLPAWVVERHWPATREALADCEPRRVAALSDAEAARILEAPGVLRNGAKLQAARHNARVLCALWDTWGSLEAYRDAVSAPGVQSLIDDLSGRLRLVGPVSAARIAQELGADCLVPHPGVLRVLSCLGWCAEDAEAADVQVAAAQIAAELPQPYPVSRLGAALLAFGTGRWGMAAVCSEDPSCHLCPVRASCAQGALAEGVDAA